jgi:hypothetical protein
MYTIFANIILYSDNIVQTSALTKSCRYDNGRKSCMIGSAKFVLTGSPIGLADSVVVIALMMDATNTFTAMIYAKLGSSTPEVDDNFFG